MIYPLMAMVVTIILGGFLIQDKAQELIYNLYILTHPLSTSTGHFFLLRERQYQIAIRYKK